MQRTIQGVTYYAKTKKEGNNYYPFIEYYGSKFGSQSYYINSPQTTRSKALTIAKEAINKISN